MLNTVNGILSVILIKIRSGNAQTNQRRGVEHKPLGTMNSRVHTTLDQISCSDNVFHFNSIERDFESRSNLLSIRLKR